MEVKLDVIGRIIEVIVLSIVIFGLPIIVANNKKSEFNEMLNGAGIERIVKCNNAYSNWYEIVWIESNNGVK